LCMLSTCHVHRCSSPTVFTLQGPDLWDEHLESPLWQCY